jgi:hypothetical protein
VLYTHILNLEFVVSMKSSILALIVSAVSGHYHPGDKPTGYFYGIKADPNARKTKIWNNMEIQMNFKENTLDFEWWYGMQISIVKVEKQTFSCKDVPFAFNGKAVIIEPQANECLKKINEQFRGVGLSEPCVMPVQPNGDIRFSAAKGVVYMDMHAISEPLAAIPSGKDGRAPESTPGPRKCDHSHDDHSHDDHSHDHATTSAPKAQAQKMSDGNHAGAKLGSVFVSAAALVLAGIYM